MAIQFDTSKATMFRNVNFGNENAIANLDGKGGLKANGQYSLFGKFSRTDVQRADNNAIRTALLKSLGEAFGLSGMTAEGGVVRFSKGFMDRLEQILGRKVLKRGDFDIGADGIVKSGKPLTQRRITAIITKATMAYKTTFDMDVYREKLDVIKKELGLTGLQGDALKAKLSDGNGLYMIMLADRGLDFLQNQLFLEHTIVDPKNNQPKTVYGPKNESRDRSFIRVNPDYVDCARYGMSTEGISMYQVRTEDNGGYKPFDKVARDKVVQKHLPGQVFHLNWSGSKGLTYEDLEKDKRYLFNTTQLVVQKMVDLYFESKNAGKLNKFMSFLEHGMSGCMEEKGNRLTKFEEENFGRENVEGEQLSTAEIAELERIADAPVGAPVDKQIYGVIEELQKNDAKYKDLDEWKDFAGPIKEKLIGKMATIMSFTKDEARNQYKFEPLLNKQGQPVVRKLTAEDIDRMGPACLYNTLGY